MKKIPDKKLKIVQEFKDLVKQNPIVGIVNMENLPAKQLQNMREQMRGTVVIKMTKKRLMKIILEATEADKKGVDKLLETLKGMPAMIFTKENPFTLYKKLDSNKSSAPAKAGQTANIDIVIPAGPTPFSPGPIIGELGALKIKAGIEDGKVAIKEDATVVKEGEEISAQIAGILTRLGIEPMEVGLDLVAVYENGEIFAKDVLAIDEDEFMSKIAAAASDSFKLAIAVGIVTSDTIKPMLQNAYQDAKALGLSQSIEADEILIALVAKAEAGMSSLKSQLNLPDAPKVDKPAPEAEKTEPEPKVEETPAPEVEKAEPEAVKEETPAPEVEKAEPEAVKEETPAPEAEKAEPEAEKEEKPAPEAEKVEPEAVKEEKPAAEAEKAEPEAEKEETHAPEADKAVPEPEKPAEKATEESTETPDEPVEDIEPKDDQSKDVKEAPKEADVASEDKTNNVKAPADTEKSD